MKQVIVVSKVRSVTLAPLCVCVSGMTGEGLCVWPSLGLSVTSGKLHCDIMDILRLLPITVFIISITEWHELVFVT